MAFRIVKQLPNIKGPVKVRQPSDNGKTTEHEFTAVFKPLSQEDYDQGVKDGLSDAQFVRLFLVGWEGLQDEDGNDIPFSDEFIDVVMSFPFVRKALLGAYQTMINGIEVKN